MKRRKKCKCSCGGKFLPDFPNQQYRKEHSFSVRRAKVARNVSNLRDRKLGIPLIRQFSSKELKFERYCARKNGTTDELNSLGRKVKGYRGDHKLTEEEKSDRAWYIKHHGPIPKIEDWTQPKGMPDEEYNYLLKNKFYGKFKEQRKYYKKSHRSHIPHIFKYFLLLF